MCLDRSITLSTRDADPEDIRVAVPIPTGAAHSETPTPVPRTDATPTTAWCEPYVDQPVDGRSAGGSPALSPRSCSTRVRMTPPSSSKSCWPRHIRSASGCTVLASKLAPFDIEGRRIPTVTQEDGAGRGEQPIMALANLTRQARYARHATRAPGQQSESSRSAPIRDRSAASWDTCVQVSQLPHRSLSQFKAQSLPSHSTVPGHLTRDSKDG